MNTLYKKLGLLLLSASLHAQFGVLDNSFSSDGKVVTPIGAGDMADFVKSVAIQSDGKIVVVGPSNYDIALVRYNVDGTLDTDFDTDGIVITDINSSNEYVSSCHVLSNGKIIVVGETQISSREIFVLRFNDNGSLDNTFDTDGKATYTIGSGDAYCLTSKILSNEQIVIVGAATGTSNLDFAILKINADGTLDNTFDSDGKVLTDMNGNSDIITSVDEQSDGKLVVAGYANNGTNHDFAIARYDENGVLDVTFDSDGKVILPIGSSNDRPNALAVLSDGSIIVSGYADNGSNNDVALAKLTSSGALDVTFDGDGIVTTAVGTSGEEIRSLLIQPDGKIIAGGVVTIAGGTDNFLLLRYSSTGVLDATFGTGGIVSTDFQSDDDGAHAMAFNNDGTIIVAGGSYLGTNLDFALAKYTSGITSTSDVSFIGLSAVSLFPNPGENRISLNYSLISDNNISITLSSADGRLKKELLKDTHRSAGDQSEYFELDNELAPGMYYLQIGNGQSFSSIKFSKIK